VSLFPFKSVFVKSSFVCYIPALVHFGKYSDRKPFLPGPFEPWFKLLIAETCQLWLAAQVNMLSSALVSTCISVIRSEGVSLVSAMDFKDVPICRSGRIGEMHGTTMWQTHGDCNIVLRQVTEQAEQSDQIKKVCNLELRLYL